MKKQTFIVGTIILTLGGFIAKIIGAFYKIPLTNILGSTGMGIYYLVFPLYNLMLVFASSGVSVAVTKLVSKERVLKNKRNETTYFKAGLFISFVISIVFTIIVLVFYKTIAYAQGNILSKLGFIAIAPSIIFASLVAIIKGYFQGIENMIPSSLSMIIEQIVKLVAGLIFSYIFIPYGIEYAVMGSVLAVSLSEAVTLIIMTINYRYHKKHNDDKFYSKDITNKLKSIEIIANIKRKRKYNKANKIKIKTIYYFHKTKKIISFKVAVKNMIRIILPNTLISLVLPLISFFDSFIVINLLTKVGYSSVTATSLYGINNGVVSSLVSLPIIITSSIATAVVPNLSGLIQTKNNDEINDRVSFFIKITFIIVLPIFLFFIIFSDSIISALYNFGVNNVINEYGFAYKLLFISSVAIIYNAFLSTFISILQSIDKTYNAFFIMLFAFIVRTILAVIMLQNLQYNIFGLVISQIVFLLICDIGFLIVIKKHIDLKINIVQSYILPCFSLAISGIITFLISRILININIWLGLIFCGIILISIYALLLIFFRCFDNVDIKYIPFLRRFRRLKK